MTDTKLQRMAQAAAVIRRVVGHDFRCHVPETWAPWPASGVVDRMDAPWWQPDVGQSKPAAPAEAFPDDYPMRR